MRKNAFTLILCLFSIISFSQNKWTLGFSVQPGKSSLYVHDEIFDLNYTSERYKQGQFSYIISGKLKFHLKNRLIFTTGLNYGRFSYQLIDDRKYYTEAGLLLRSEIDKNTDIWQSWTYIPHYQFAGIPLRVSTRVFEFYNFNISLQAGSSVNYIFHENSTNIDVTELGEKKYLELSPLFSKKINNPVFFQLEFALVLSFQINKKTTISANPTYQFALTKFESDFIASGKFQNFGIDLGIDFLF